MSRSLLLTPHVSPTPTLDTALLALIRPTIDSALIDAVGWSRIAAVCQRLPHRVSTFYGFECRLGDADPHADLLFSLTRASDQGAQLLAAVPEQLRGNEPTATTAWQAVARFLAAWRTPGHCLAQTDRLWVELDCASSARPAPCFFFGLDAEHTIDQRIDCVLSALTLLRHAPPSVALQQALAAALAYLPTTAWPFQVGCMLGRGDAGVRLCVRGLAVDTALDWLAQAGWSGRLDGLRAALDTYAPLVASFDLDVDLGADGALAERIGIELACTPVGAEQADASAVLDQLVAAQLCTPAQAAALRRYPAYESAAAAQQTRWPDGPPASSALLAYRLIPVLIRYVNHIKLGWSGGRITDAKAYLAVSHEQCAWSAALHDRQVLNQSHQSAPAHCR